MTEYDWHDSACDKGESIGFGGDPMSWPCNCEMPRLLRVAFDDGLAEAKRRLSAVGMHDGKCPEPRRRCTCGIDDAVDGKSPEMAAIEP